MTSDSVKAKDEIGPFFTYIRALTKAIVDEHQTQVIISPSHKVRLYCQHIAAILLYGEGCEIQFKVYFMYPDAQAFAAAAKNTKPQKVTKSIAIDFFKEHCNIIAGRIQSDTTKAGIVLGHSLPFAMLGYNEVFLNDQYDVSYSDKFVLSNGNNSVIYSTDLTFSCPTGQKIFLNFDPAKIDLGKSRGHFEIL